MSEQMQASSQRYKDKGDFKIYTDFLDAARKETKNK